MITIEMWSGASIFHSKTVESKETTNKKPLKFSGEMRSRSLIHCSLFVYITLSGVFMFYSTLILCGWCYKDSNIALVNSSVFFLSRHFKPNLEPKPNSKEPNRKQYKSHLTTEISTNCWSFIFNYRLIMDKMMPICVATNHKHN